MDFDNGLIQDLTLRWLILTCSKKSFILQPLDEVDKGWEMALDLELIEFS
jgi:hypothetical protein